MTKEKRTLIRFIIISFDISRAIQSLKSQSEPTRVRNWYREPARDNESKPEPPSYYKKCLEWLSNRGHFLCQDTEEDTFYVRNGYQEAARANERKPEPMRKSQSQPVSIANILND